MRGLGVVLSGACFALACAEPAPRPRAVPPPVALAPVAPAPVAPAPVSLAELTALAKQHCASCHQASVSQQKPAALAVFDLDQPSWSASLSADQLQVFYQRMQGELDAPTRPRLLAFTEAAAARAAPASGPPRQHPPE